MCVSCLLMMLELKNMNLKELGVDDHDDHGNPIAREPPIPLSRPTSTAFLIWSVSAEILNNFYIGETSQQPLAA